MFNRLRSISKPPSPVDDSPTISEPIMDPPLNIPTPIASLDDIQQEKLSNLRQHFDSFLLPKTDDYYENEKAFLTDNTLRRYLRARKWDEQVSCCSLQLVNAFEKAGQAKPSKIRQDSII